MRRAEIDRRIGELDNARRSSLEPRKVLELLTSLEHVDIPDADLLARLHEALLFHRAYPGAPSVLRRAESMLQRFGRRVAASDMDVLLDEEVSGIAGTSIVAVFSYDLVRWLVGRFPGKLAIDWDEPPAPESLAALLTPIVPFLEEEASVDANVPYLTWLKAAQPRARDGGLAWILRSLEQLDLPPHHRAAIFDSLGFRIHWQLGNSAMTRTLMRRPQGATFDQNVPRLEGSDVSLAAEIASKPLGMTKLSRREGEEALDIARAALATRYREIYAFTWGDPTTVLSAAGGRGLEFLLCGVTPSKRLPLRAGFGLLMLRNGIPIGYGDAFGICERMEVSFNIFYAFRGGESAFCFARLLKLYHQVFGATSFSIDPYQIGMGNDEAIEAGAFWFYRKLGFRSADPLVERIVEREESRIAIAPKHRTSVRTLKKIAQSPLIYEVPRSTKGKWDRFHIRNIGLGIERRFARDNGSAEAFHKLSRERVAASLRVSVRTLSMQGRGAFDRLAPVLALIPDLNRWSVVERAAVWEIIRAKAGRREAKYLRLLSRHMRLRRALLRLGASPRSHRVRS